MWIDKLKMKIGVGGASSFKDAFYKWLEIYAPLNKKTTQMYKNIIDAHLLVVLECVELDQLALTHIVEIYERLSHLSPKTLSRTSQVLKRVLVFTGEIAGCDYSKIIIEIPRFNNKEGGRERFLTYREISTLFDVLKRKKMGREALFCQIALLTGARLTSILELRKRDIDFDMGLVKLTNFKVRGRVYYNPLSEELAQILKPKLYKLKPDDKIIRLGKTLLTERLRVVLNETFNKGLAEDDRANRVVIHTFRHTFASLLVNSGEPLVNVCKLLDHSDIRETMRYAHLSPHLGRNGVAKLSNTIFKHKSVSYSEEVDSEEDEESPYE